MPSSKWRHSLKTPGLVIFGRLYMKENVCRYILRQRGRDKQVHVSHSNNHGSQTVKKEEVMKLFKGIPTEVIDNLVRRLRPDFELCGYNKTLQWIMELNKRSWSFSTHLLGDFTQSRFYRTTEEQWPKHQTFCIVKGTLLLMRDSNVNRWMI